MCVCVCVCVWVGVCVCRHVCVKVLIIYKSFWKKERDHFLDR